MRILAMVAAAALLLTAGCSKRAEEPRSPDLKTFDASESSDSSAASGSGASGSPDARVAPSGMVPPSIGPTAAPGVAFNYKYDFQLADEKISAVQEAHAARCEALGVARCRIIGLNYTIGAHDTVSATLELKLAPDIARSYGREASGAVIQAGGRLSHTEFTGTDTAPSTGNAISAQGEAQARIAEIEQRLAANPKDAERAQLQAELAQLRQTVSGAKAQLADNRAALASTPMSFNYYGKGGISGFAGRNPLVDAGQSFVESMVAMITVVLQLLAYVLPWLLLLGLLLMVWRVAPFRQLSRWWKGKSMESEDVVAD